VDVRRKMRERHGHDVLTIEEDGGAQRNHHAPAIHRKNPVEDDLRPPTGLAVVPKHDGIITTKMRKYVTYF